MRLLVFLWLGVSGGTDPIVILSGLLTRFSFVVVKRTLVIAAFFVSVREGRLIPTLDPRISRLRPFIVMVSVSAAAVIMSLVVIVMMIILVIPITSYVAAILMRISSWIIISSSVRILLLDNRTGLMRGIEATTGSTVVMSKISAWPR
jgi:hypothetical protein